MDKKLDIFMILKDINLAKSFSLHKDDNFNKQYDAFMINRYLSMNPETVLEANCMNKYNKLGKNVQYLFYSSIIEKKDRFLKYIKSDLSKENKDLIKYIQKLFIFRFLDGNYNLMNYYLLIINKSEVFKIRYILVTVV